jgi:hypothetical protein
VQGFVIVESITSLLTAFIAVVVAFNMRQVQPETLPKNSVFSSCLQNIKLKNNPNNPVVMLRSRWSLH